MLGRSSRHYEPSPRTNHHRHRTACPHTLAPPHAARRSVGGMKNARHTRGAANTRGGSTLSVRSCQQTRTCVRRAMVRQRYEHIPACTIYALIATVQTSIFTREGFCQRLSSSISFSMASRRLARDLSTSRHGVGGCHHRLAFLREVLATGTD